MPVLYQWFHVTTDTCLIPPSNCGGKSALCRRSAALWSRNSCNRSPCLPLRCSLIERFLRAGDTLRAAPAYYLSRSEHGRSMLTYVKKEELAVVRQHCTAYRAFQQNLKAWRRVTAALQQRWEQLQQAQSR